MRLDRKEALRNTGCSIFIIAAILTFVYLGHRQYISDKNDPSPVARDYRQEFFDKYKEKLACSDSTKTREYIGLVREPELFDPYWVVTDKDYNVIAKATGTCVVTKE